MTSLPTIAAVLLFACGWFLPAGCLTQSAQPRLAAGIAYTVVTRPDGLPSEFRGSSAVELRFLRLTALDSGLVPAALWQPIGRRPRETPLIIDVHGSARSFDAAPNGALERDLSTRGYAVLGINTRQSRERTNTDNFMEVRADIEAAVFTARAMGYRTLVLHGHSLGNIHVQFYAATSWASDIKAVILTGMFANLPWKSRHVLVRNEQSWLALQNEALAALREGDPQRILTAPMSWINGEEVHMSARHVLTYRAEESSTAVGTYWIPRIPYPILMVRDAGDTIVVASEPEELLAAARIRGSLVPSIDFVELPNAVSGREEHYFVHNARMLAATVAQWLAAHAIE